MNNNINTQSSFILRLLNRVERTGNRLPHPTVLFFYLGLFILVLSALLSWLDWHTVHPISGESIHVINLLDPAGINRILGSLIVNFVGFPPLGTVLLSMLGFGIAERTGLINALLRGSVLSAPKKLLTGIVVFVGVMSNLASDAGYVVFIPLAALIFLAVGRHPLAGIAAGFAGVSGGYSANLVVGPLEPLLAGITQAAAQVLSTDITVTPLANYYFIVVSTVFITIAGTWITEKIIVPRLGEYTGDKDTANEFNQLHLQDYERKGLRWAGVALVILTALVLWGILPENGALRDGANGSVLVSTVMSTGLIALIFLIFSITGVAYGLGARTITTSKDVVTGMETIMSSVASFIVMMFFAAQFITFFAWSNIGLILAFKGALLIQALGLTNIWLVVALILLSALVNLFIGSASAKWALLAPVFVPMFMLSGLSPEFVQAAYRVGDSATNIITPMMPYIAVIIPLVQRYQKGAGIGTTMALMLPYSVIFLIGWTLIMVVWFWLGIPVGPGAPTTIDVYNLLNS